MPTAASPIGLAFALLAVVGCQADGGRASGAGEGEVSGGVADERWVALPGAGTQPWTDPGEGVPERGVGVVYIAPDPWEAQDGTDTLVVRGRPAPDAAPVALFLRDTLYAFELRLPDRLDAPRGLAMEFAYEEIGLPGDAPPGPDGWTPVLYAVEGTDTLSGWVRVDDVQAGWIGWGEQLRGLPLFIAVPMDSIRFFDAPEGDPRPIPLGDDYILHPLEDRGRWLRIEIVRPSDYCADPVSPRRDTAWVRHLDDRDRPRLWYYTRGC